MLSATTRDGDPRGPMARSDADDTRSRAIDADIRCTRSSTPTGVPSIAGPPEGRCWTHCRSQSRRSLRSDGRASVRALDENEHASASSTYLDEDRDGSSVRHAWLDQSRCGHTDSMRRPEIRCDSSARRRSSTTRSRSRCSQRLHRRRCTGRRTTSCSTSSRARDRRPTP